MARTGEKSARRRGFTLVEILVALAVMSVAVSVFLSLFTASLDLAQSNRNKTIAASLAEEQMAALLRAPNQYDWHLQKASSGELVEITAAASNGENDGRFTPPGVLPVLPQASTREEILYAKFSWHAYCRLPRADANYLEVTVAVRWSEEGRARVVTLTSSASRMLVASTGRRAEGSA